MLFILIGIALAFDFINGSNDSANIVATAISSRALSPRAALAITAGSIFLAPFLFGVAVATTIGKGLIDPAAITLPIVFAALLAAITWNLLTRSLGIPSSSSHALIGGLLGSAFLAKGFSVIELSVLAKVLIALFVSPLLGMVAGFLLMELTLFFCMRTSPRVNNIFKRLQIVTLLSLAFSYGSNDAQKTMGIITLGLVAAGVQQSFNIPLWVIAASAGSISLGAMFGGWRLIRTLGGRIYTIRPVHAFTSQAASATIILGAALMGGPVSTTQVISTSIVGAGAAERMKKVRWGVAQEMATAWVLTIPVSAVISALLFLLISQMAPLTLLMLAQH
jgi:PiT family inorganic phosphate transporter